MTLTAVWNIIGWVGGLLAYATLVVIAIGIWRGTQQKAGRTSGKVPNWVRSPLYYILTTVCFLFLSIIFWMPLPFNPPLDSNVSLLIIGSMLYFPAIALVLWARHTLGKMYLPSTSFGVSLNADHKLVTGGPYAFVRHPLYVGIICAAIGALLLYHTWTALAYAVFAPFLAIRSKGEEQALKAAFGEEWLTYSRQVPAFIPLLKQRSKKSKK